MGSEVVQHSGCVLFEILVQQRWTLTVAAQHRVISAMRLYPDYQRLQRTGSFVLGHTEHKMSDVTSLLLLTLDLYDKDASIHEYGLTAIVNMYDCKDRCECGKVRAVVLNSLRHHGKF